jgi:hypothetical protein
MTIYLYDKDRCRPMQTIWSRDGTDAANAGNHMNTIDGSVPDFHERLSLAKEQLRQQQMLVPEIESPMIRESIIKLLSSGLRTFCWLEKEARGADRGPRQLP